jgi:hypothetical protein
LDRISTDASINDGNGDTIWYCASRDKIIKYRMSGNEMKDLSDILCAWMSEAKREGCYPRYQVLQNTADGIIAVLADASHDEQSVSVYADVILINKKNGQFRRAMVSTEKSNAQMENIVEVRGTCTAGDK